LIKISSNEAKDTAIKYSLIQSVIDIINFDSNLILNKNIKIFSYPCFYSDKMQIKAQIKFKSLYLVFISSLGLIKIIKTIDFLKLKYYNILYSNKYLKRCVLKWQKYTDILICVIIL